MNNCNMISIIEFSIAKKLRLAGTNMFMKFKIISLKALLLAMMIFQSGYSLQSKELADKINGFPLGAS